MPTADFADFDPGPAEFTAVAAYDTLRRRGPVVPIRLADGLTAWVVTEHRLGRAVLTDPVFAKALPTRDSADPEAPGVRRYPEDIMAVEGRHMLNTDPPDHTRLRAVAAVHFSQSAIAAREPQIARTATELAERMAESTRADLMASFARPLPELVLTAILGIPEDLQVQAVTLTRILGGREDPASPPMRNAYADLVDLLHEVVRGPADAGTVVAGLLAAAAEHRISRREMVSTVAVLLGAGITSTATAIGNGALILMRHIDIRHELLTDHNCANSVVDELLRHHPSFPFSPWRFATREIALADRVIPQGSLVLVLLTSANRDPAVFPNGDTVCADRPARAASLTFGHGRHFCIGVHLAKAETRIALTTLFTRFPHIRPALDEHRITWTGILLDRTITALPVHL